LLKKIILFFVLKICELFRNFNQLKNLLVMKHIAIILSLVILCCLPYENYAQVKIKKKAEKKIDEGLDKLLFGKKKKKKTEAEQKETTPAQTEVAGEKAATDQTATGVEEENTLKGLKAWSKYDFVPGDIIIFEDNLDGEEISEFPSKWDLYNGNAEIALFNEEKVINFASSSTIVPLMKKEGDYLPEKFTVEFDGFFDHGGTSYYIYLFDYVADKGKPEQLGEIAHIVTYYNSANTGRYNGAIPEIGPEVMPLWRHIALSFNVRSMKLYLDETRLLNIPNVKGDPKGLSIYGYTPFDNQVLIKNVRVAEGAKKLYDRILTDGKIITSAIKFDAGKATIKPQSMGMINKVYNLMKEHQEIKFSVEGHTDSDGDEQLNQKLSEERAAAVKEKLVDMGIEDSRLTTKGWGEGKPIHDNSSPEGKANNRRVEFVKL
jgi:OOP family OmpA-OmpF porin